MVPLYSTEKSFAYYMNTCPAHLKALGLFDVLYAKVPTSKVLQVPAMRKVARQAVAPLDAARLPHAAQGGTYVV